MRLAIMFVLATGLGILAAVFPAASQTVAKSDRMKRYEMQTRVLDARLAARAGRFGDQGASPAYAGPRGGPYFEMARAAARRYRVPEDLFLRLVQHESGWRPSARSRKGAFGLAQLMPATARALGVDRSSPRENLEGGARYLRQQYDRFGSWRLALAAYNAGPEAVEKYRGVPPYQETRNYLRRILGG